MRSGAFPGKRTGAVCAGRVEARAHESVGGVASAMWRGSGMG